MLKSRLHALVAIRRPVLIGALVAGLLIISTVIVLTGGATAARPEPWPGFTMVYRDTATSGGPEGATISQTFRLTYVDQRHFRTTLLSHSTRPDAVGWMHEVSGRTSRVNDPRLGVVQDGQMRPDELTLPADWLTPTLRPRISQDPAASVIDLATGLARATLVSSSGRQRVVEEITYRTSDGIPMLFVQQVNGRETRRAEVIELRVDQN